ncbi:hypothetical protein ACFQ78_10925 [Streptomyces sp. NPDC056519]|uniref:hypothetical protein n=1 Tax=Streptomyces sp. NPDC056519 TaxID=3345849 RepID=UPI0036C9FF0A
MIETVPDGRPRPGRRGAGAVSRTAADPAAAPRALVQRRQALVHQEPADLESLRS